MRYPLIVFDWDGTILDSHQTIVDCMQQACRDLGLPVPEAERASHVIGLGLHDAMRIVAPALEAARYPEFVARYRAHFLRGEETIRLFPGMEALLDWLAASRRLAIATGKSRRGLDRALAATGLSRCFSASRCADETTPKPHPAMLLELMDELDVPPSEVLMIGDTSHDLEMARAAGVDAVAMSYGAHPAERLRACGPLGCFGSVAELASWLRANG